MDGEPVILESAHRHGVSEDDMLHALEYAIRVAVQEDGVSMYLGPARPGHPVLEVGVVQWHGVYAIVHAMPARPKYLDR